MKNLQRIIVLTSITFFLFVTPAHADSVAYKERVSDRTIQGNFQYKYYPIDCVFIKQIKDNPYRYIVRDKENLSRVNRKCFLYNAGRSVKDGKDAAFSAGKNLFERSGAKSFLRGLRGD